MPSLALTTKSVLFQIVGSILTLTNGSLLACIAYDWVIADYDPGRFLALSMGLMVLFFGWLTVRLDAEQSKTKSSSRGVR